jgi:hypothetical protein
MKKLPMTNKSNSVAGHFDDHGGAPGQYILHFSMQHVQGYLRSHWMLPSGDYSLRITPAAAKATGKLTMMNKYTYFSGHFDGHGNAPIRNCVHCPMEEVQGSTRSHWMPPLGKYYVR